MGEIQTGALKRKGDRPMETFLRDDYFAAFLKGKPQDGEIDYETLHAGSIQ
jgi:hypothetical protein